jgi:RNA polymerase sigma-70 factor (ECF subfamily)
MAHQTAFRAVTESGIYPVYTPEELEKHFEDDTALIAGMIANSPVAWRAFQRRYDGLVHRCIRKVTRRFASIVSKDDLREIYATLCLALLSNDKHKLRVFDPARGNRFSSWIGLLAINAAYDYLRMLKREPRKEQLAEAAELAAEMPDPFDLAVERQHALIAQKSLEDFSDQDRAFTALYFGEGMEPAEIAQRMNIAVKTVYSRKHKIQSRLESLLAQGQTDNRGNVEQKDVLELGGVSRDEAGETCGEANEMHEVRSSRSRFKAA